MGATPHIKVTGDEKIGTLKTAETIIGVGDIIKQRSGTHGDAFKNLEDIARRWSLYISKAKSGNDYFKLELTVADVAYMMVEMKLSRATYGDNAEVDHFMDMIGYAGIGAAFTKTLKEDADEPDIRATPKPVQKPHHGLMPPRARDAE
jgi:Domain of unknown function (DUF6378)